MAEVTFTDAAIDDLRRIGPDAVPKVLKKVLILLDSPDAGYPLGGELTGFRKLVVGRNTWRIVYRVVDEKQIEICEVWAVGARADAEVYAEATARVQAAPSREPVPDWLAQRLIHTVGMAPQHVAALSLEEAVDRWGEFTSKSR